MSKYCFMLIVVLCMFSNIVNADTKSFDDLKNAVSELETGYWSVILRGEYCIERDKKLVSYNKDIQSYKERNMPVRQRLLQKQKKILNPENVPAINEKIDDHFASSEKLYRKMHSDNLPQLDKIEKVEMDKFCKQWLQSLAEGKLDLKNKYPNSYSYIMFGKEKDKGALLSVCKFISSMSQSVAKYRDSGISRNKAIKQIVESIQSDNLSEDTKHFVEKTVKDTLEPISISIYENPKLEPSIAEQYGFWRCLTSKSSDFTDQTDKKIIAISISCQEKSGIQQERIECIKHELKKNFVP